MSGFLDEAPPAVANRTPSEASIRVRDLAFSYSEKRALLKIKELDIESGQIVSILGPSGCGKTTLMLLLAGLLAPHGGLTIFGSPPQVFRATGKMAVVFQNPGLLSWRTVMGNLRLPFELQGRVAADSELEEVLALVGLTESKDAYPDQLSGGMQTRVALARALGTKPSLLLMDEPFGNLDEFNRVRLNLQLAALQRKLSTSIVIITHNVHDAILISDRILVLKPDAGGVTHIAEDVSVSFPNKTIESTATKEFQHLYHSVVQHFYENIVLST